MKADLTCVILVGGLGTRLRSVLPDVPKPMARINGRPFLEYLLIQVRQSGVTDILLCVGYKARVIENYFGDGGKFGVRIRYSLEEDLLGTAGALANARPLIKSDPFLVLNGDSYCAVGFEGLIKRHHAHDAVATIVATRVDDRLRFGSLALGPNDAITHFTEKSLASPAGYINAGIYVLSQGVLGLVSSGKYSSLERDIFPSLAGRGLYAFRTSDFFIDIGTPSEFHRAQSVLKDYLESL